MSGWSISRSWAIAPPTGDGYDAAYVVRLTDRTSASTHDLVVEYAAPSAVASVGYAEEIARRSSARTIPRRTSSSTSGERCEWCRNVRKNQVPTPKAGEGRRAALEAYLATCESRGFRVESRTDTQAVIVRRGRFARYRRGRGSTRVVVWVDEHGNVERRSIEARRW